MSSSASFFHAMAPTLMANILTVTFVYCFAKVAQKERNRQEGRSLFLWLLMMIVMIVLYGYYTWTA